ncbi:MAG: TraB/GumN family protein [Parachlamydia sp.]|jgi:hypothetical protein|nr:TraB/GumN family protein [Parachlamydia sp.]
MSWDAKDADEKFKDLSARGITAAINKSARIILESPYGSDLLPTELFFFDNLIMEALEMINDLISKIEDSQVEDSQVEDILIQIKNELNEDDFKKIEMALYKIILNQYKFIFLNKMQENISNFKNEFGYVSYENSINSLFKNKKIEALEKINLREEINKALQKIQEREQKEAVEKLQESEKKEEAKQVEKESDENKINTSNHRAALYQAWKEGNEEELGKIIDNEFKKIFKEPEEMAAVHDPRDKQMAENIIQAIREEKNNKNEAILVVMGMTHLVYSQRTNVISHLRENFHGDLSNWKIKQVKIKNST